jgi:hypothetical protein
MFCFHGTCEVKTEKAKSKIVSCKKIVQIREAAIGSRKSKKGPCHNVKLEQNRTVKIELFVLSVTVKIRICLKAYDNKVSNHLDCYFVRFSSSRLLLQNT